jgi:hypothetical protein
MRRNGQESRADCDCKVKSASTKSQKLWREYIETTWLKDHGMRKEMRKQEFKGSTSEIKFWVYSLESKGHVLKVWIPAYGTTGTMAPRVGPGRRKPGHCGHDLDGNMRTPAPSSPSPPGQHEISSFLCHMFLPWHVALPQAQKPLTMEWNLLNADPKQNKTFLIINWLSQVFCHSGGKQTNTRTEKRENFISVTLCHIYVSQKGSKWCTFYALTSHLPKYLGKLSILT